MAHDVFISYSTKDKPVADAVLERAKTQKTPDEDLELARSNKGKHQRGLQ